MNPHFERAQLLMNQGRYELAKQELHQTLAANPQDPMAHGLMSLCLTGMEEYAEAIESGKQAVALGPDESFCHYALGAALFNRDHQVTKKESVFGGKQDFMEAETAIREAIRIEPFQSHYFALLSSIRLARRDFKGALEAAEGGLEIDPQDVTCTNCRAQALVNLGRKEEAGEALDTALAEDPEDAFTHANKGWALLHAGQPHQAREHFKEALRLDPTLEWAQAGMVEALKARNFLYRWMLTYFMWMSTLSAGVQWGVVLGGYVLIRVLAAVGKANPALQPWLLPIQILYFLFAILTWTAPHLFNLMLRLDHYGKYLLTRDQVVGANCVGACLLGGILLGAVGLIIPSLQVVVAGMGAMALMIPVGGTFNREGKARRILASYTVGLIVVGLLAFGLALMQSPMAGSLGGIYMLGLVLFGWVANAMAIR